MTRKEEKIKASKEYGIENPIFLDGVGYDEIRPAVDFSKGVEWADSHPVNKIVYVVTRSEEHNDYVEAVFYNRENAEKYCKQFNDNEDEYHRNITETIIKD